jgi:hypothetical protein
MTHAAKRIADVHHLPPHPARGLPAIPKREIEHHLIILDALMRRTLAASHIRHPCRTNRI